MAARWRRALHLIALAACGVGCRAPQPSPSASASAAHASDSSPPLAVTAPSSSARPEGGAGSGRAPAKAELPRLIEAHEFVALAVPEFRDAVVSVPTDGREPRVLVLALHGNFDRPEWQCEVWRRITRAQQWVLCPRGIPRRDVPKELDRWEWGSRASTKRELVAAIAALRARYGEHVSPAPLVFTGFSLGAILGASLISDPELGVGAAVLVEGGYRGWTAGKAKALGPGFGRLLFACGQTECRNAYRFQLEPLFQRAVISTALVADVKAGHTYDDPLAALVAAEWDALIASLNPN